MTSLFPSRAGLVSLFALAVLVPVLRAQLNVTSLTVLGTLGGSNSYATGINASGQVVGYADTPGNAGRHAFLYSNGAMTDLGTLGGTNSSGLALNASGQVVGSAQTSGNAANHAFLYSNGTMTDLGTLGGTNSSANAINDSGQIVGAAQTAGNTSTLAVLYGSGTNTKLGGLVPNPSYSGATGINANGQIVGYSESASGTSHPFIYHNGSMTDLGTLAAGQVHSDGAGINASGQVAGSSQYDLGIGVTRAFIYSGGPLVDIGALGLRGAFDDLSYGSNATGINSFGQIVGTSTFYYQGSPFPARGFFYSDGVMYDLQTAAINYIDVPFGQPHFKDLLPQGLNDAGQIVGVGHYSDGTLRGFVMSVSAIPEPGTYAMLAGAAVFAFALGGRRSGAWRGAPKRPTPA